MAIYWLLFAFPAIMALAYPLRSERVGFGPAQSLALFAFVLAYSLLGMLRYETGGDWETYGEIFDEIATDTLAYALTRTDPLYGLLNWASAQIGTGIYLPNGICCAILGYGTVRVAMTMREPWLAILIAVPYMLIVVGFGYVRQGAAIGLIMIAIASLDQARPYRTLAYLAIATLFHISAALVFPLFVLALTRRNRALALAISLIGALVFMLLLFPRLDRLEQGYITSEYESGGAMVRSLMSLLPALLVLARRKALGVSDRSRSVWIMMALANLLVFGALLVSSSSTAIDRVALLVAAIQLVAYGHFRDLVAISDRMALLARLALIGVAAAVQSVWLIFGTHAEHWVPYKSVLQFL